MVAVKDISLTIDRDTCLENTFGVQGNNWVTKIAHAALLIHLSGPMAAPIGPVSAAQAIGEYLQSPDDLVKVSAFRKKLEKEKASIDTRLNNGVKEQLQATRLGLKKFLGTRENVQAIKDEMVSIEKECDDTSVRVATFDQISRVCLSSLK